MQIRIKSGVGVPSTLLQGELALNTTDNTIYIGDSGNNPVRLVGTIGSQEPSNVFITGGTASNSNITAQTLDANTVQLPDSEILFYDENNDCRDFITNWNRSEVFNMTDCAGLGNCHIHGWAGSATTYTLNLSGLPAHTEVKYECIIHMVDSWDNEAVTIRTQNAAGGVTQKATWTKSNGLNQLSNLATSDTTVSYYGNKWYSYAPWNSNLNSCDGYAKVTTDWYAHTSSNFTAEHYTGLDQAQSDEAFYISHVKLYLRGSLATLNAIDTQGLNWFAGSDSSKLTTGSSIATAKSEHQGTIKRLVSYTTSGNHTYTKSGSDVRMLRVILVGGGGGGRGSQESGGAGGFAERWIDATNITSVSITVGGGSGGGYYFGVSEQGGTTSFGSYLSATGGYGANQNRQHAGGHGGYGSGGVINLYGGGGNGHARGYNNQGSGLSGQGGASFFGGGTQGRHGSRTFSNAAASGAGGAGGAGNHNGGNGREGAVLVYEYI